MNIPDVWFMTYKEWFIAYLSKQSTSAVRLSVQLLFCYCYQYQEKPKKKS